MIYLFLSAIFGSSVALLAWPHAVFLTPAIFIFVTLLSKKNFWVPFITLFFYHLGTTYGLIQGTTEFFPTAGLFLGILFWFGSSLIFATPYLFYKKIAGTYLNFSLLSGFRSLLAVIITSFFSTVIPPLGLIGWTSPLLGFFEIPIYATILIILSIFIIGCVDFSKKNSEFYLLFFLIISILACEKNNIEPKKYILPKSWVSINTKMGKLSELSYTKNELYLESKVFDLLKSGKKVILTPEGSSGIWYKSNAQIWKPIIKYTKIHTKVNIILGAYIPIKNGHLIDALIKIHKGKTKIYPDRIPVPFSMWHPWNNFQSFKMRIFGKPEVMHINGIKVGYLICYEQLLIWPELSLINQHIKVLLAPRSDWWCKGTDIPALQNITSKIWADFFHVSLLQAENT